MFLTIKPVEIFDQFLFFIFRQSKDIALRKFFGIIIDRLIDTFGFHTVQFSHITVQNDLLITQDDDFLFHFGSEKSPTLPRK